MALKAGYQGLKNPLGKIIPLTVKQMQSSLIGLAGDVKGAWFEGGKNLLKNTAKTTTTPGNVTFTVNEDKTVTANGTASADTALSWNIGKLPKGKYILSGCPAGGGDTKYLIRLGYTDDPTVTWGTFINNDTGSGFTFEVTDADVNKLYTVALRVINGYAANNLLFKPMIRVAEDTDDTYVPYAMTNAELTGSAGEQKTAINAIISAATGAADFAAFKTAMAAITPVTRSAAPETRGASEEEPIVTKSTKKSTK